jgi:hypothetical protein
MVEQQELINKLINDTVTMVTQERFETIINHTNKISDTKGDIVECGVWKGGMSIFLSKMFPNKNIWVCDSYEGCQDPNLGKYIHIGERHTLGMYAVSLEEVKENFKIYDALDEPRVKFLKGWVRDTLHPDICDIQKISLLRIDVDSYSATLEVLDYLYDKVSKGGIIIFDDMCLGECKSAVRDFINRGNDLELYHPSTGEKVSLEDAPCGSYTFKK